MRPPDSVILEAVRRRMLQGKPMDRSTILQENIYGGPAVPQPQSQPPPQGGVSFGGGAGPSALGGVLPGPDPRNSISWDMLRQRSSGGGNL